MNGLFFQLLVICFTTMVPYGPLWAQDSVESKTATATDASGLHIFSENPALLRTQDFIFSYLQTQANHTSNVELTTTNQTTAKSTHVETDHAVSTLSPLGSGASFALTGQMLNQRIETTLNSGQTTEKETWYTKLVETHFNVDISSQFRSSLSVRYKKTDVDVAGAFFISDDERSKYSGTLTGFKTGLSYNSQDLTVGFLYTPPMKGKATLGGEEIILSDPGFLKLDVGLGKPKDFYWGFSIKRWLHRRDDQDAARESTINQRRIFLNGVAIEQWLFPVTQYQLGFNTKKEDNLYYSLSLTQTEYSFLFTENTLPGDDEDQEQRFKAYRGNISAVFNPSDFAIHLGYIFEQRKSDIDQAGGLYFGSGSYKSQQGIIFAMFSYEK